MIPRIVSFRRSGTHFLAALLHRNLETGVSKYEALHFSHSKVPEEPYIHVWRPLLPTMVSMFHMRERFGVAKSVNFAKFVSLPFNMLDESTSCSVLYDGDEHQDAHRLPFTRPLPMQWREDNLRFAEYAALSFEYSELSSQPMRVLQLVSEVFSCKEREALDLVRDRVGWVPSDEPLLDIPWRIARALEEYSTGESKAWSRVN